MTTKEAVALLERYSNYDGMGIPNLAGCKEAMRVAVDALKEAYPELRESEDERIRKAIILGIKRCEDAGSIFGTVINNEGVNYHDVLAWLEKQKELTTEDIYNAAHECIYGEEKQKEPHYTKRNALFDKCVENCDPAVIKKVSDEIDEMLRKEQNPVEIDEEINRWMGCKAFPEGTNITPLPQAMEIVERTAKHFFELGEKTVPSPGGYWEGFNHGVRECQARIRDVNDTMKEQKPAEWSEDWREEDIQTRFAFYTYKDDSSELYLSNVFVEEASRNHGFGTRILKAAEKVAEVIGATTISLKVKQNSPANAWYRKNGYGYVAFEDGYDWLEKNLEYMKPQPKQEWSNEDERKYQCIRSILLTDMDNKVGSWKYSEILEWYEKRGIGRYTNSEPHWKPSEEQMEALNALNLHGDLSYVGQQNQLISLYQDLKKL